MTRRFGRSAGLVVHRAVGVAKRHGADGIGGEHLLVGLTEIPGPAALALTAAGAQRERLDAAVAGGVQDARLLAGLGIDLLAVQERMGGRRGLPRIRRRHLPMRADAKRALEHAYERAEAIGDRRIGPEHILLGLLSGSLPAREVLLALDVDADTLRRSLSP